MKPSKVIKDRAKQMRKQQKKPAPYLHTDLLHKLNYEMWALLDYLDEQAGGRND